METMETRGEPSGNWYFAKGPFQADDKHIWDYIGYISGLGDAETAHHLLSCLFSFNSPFHSFIYFHKIEKFET
jgi:hypothetical protein